MRQSSGDAHLYHLATGFKMLLEEPVGNLSAQKLPQGITVVQVEAVP
jgi:hypothetical protein